MFWYFYKFSLTENFDDDSTDEEGSSWNSGRGIWNGCFYLLTMLREKWQYLNLKCEQTKQLILD